MKFVEIDNAIKGIVRDSNTFIKGDLKNIMILSEDDMQPENLPLVLHSKSFDILFVPNIPTMEQRIIIEPYLYDGHTQIATVRII